MSIPSLAANPGDAIDMDQGMTPAWALALQASLAGPDAWHAQWLALARRAAAASGSVLLLWDAAAARLRLQGLEAADTAGASTEVSASRLYRWDLSPADSTHDDSLMARLAATDWAPVYQAYQQAVDGASQAWAADPAWPGMPVLLDVRRAGVYEQASELLPGARWCDPARVDEWSDQWPAGQPVVVYCVFGHEVSRATALRLRAAGLDARFLAGGIDGWVKAGRPTVPKTGQALGDTGPGPTSGP